MIIQLNIDSTGNLINYPIPLSGKCRVKLIKIEYLHNTASANPNFILCRLESNSLFNNSQLGGYIYFLNVTQPFYGNEFVFDVDLPQQITVSVRQANGATLPTTAGNYASLLVTLDIEEINKMIR
jgi:hypothetical protein